MSTAPSTTASARRTVTKAAALAALGGLLFGYDTGVIGGVLPNIAQKFDLDTPFSTGLVVSVLLAGAAAGALVAGRLADRLGRRRLVLPTSVTFVVGIAVASLAPALWVLLLGRFVIGMGVGAASFGVPLYIEAVLATAALCFYIGSCAIGLGPVFWLLVSELFPLRVRGQAASVASMTNWVANLALAVSYLSIISAIGGATTFWGYAAITVVSLLYMLKAVPETRGRSLAEIERDLRGPKAGGTGAAPLAPGAAPA